MNATAADDALYPLKKASDSDFLTMLFGSFPFAALFPFAFLAFALKSSLSSGNVSATVVLSIGLCILLVIMAGSSFLFFTLRKEGRAAKAEYESDQKRLSEARAHFLSERGVSMTPSDAESFFPKAAPTDDGLVAMSQGVVNGKATMLALHQRDGELVLTGTDGQELRPLVAA